MGKITYHRIQEHSPAWHQFRTVGNSDYEGGIGGSEVSVVFNAMTDNTFNPYMSGARLFHQKVGTVSSIKDDKETMFHGRNQEDYLAKLHSYWGGDTESMMENWKNDNIVRRSERVNGYAVNSDYPWLFASLDRRMLKKGGFKMDDDRTPFDKPCPLELKTLSYHAAKKWKSKIPEYYFYQVHLYMIVFEVDYAEIAVLKDGNQFDVIPVYRDHALVDAILKLTKSFWYDMVIPAREAKKIMEEALERGDEGSAEEARGVIDQLEPEPDSTDDYTELMEERYRGGVNQIKGSKEQFISSQEYECLLGYERVIKEKKTLIKNQLINEMVKSDAEEITFEEDGYVRYRKTANAKKPSLRVNLKEKPENKLIEENLNTHSIKSY